MTSRLHLLIIVWPLIGLALPALAADPPARTHDIEVEDYFTLAGITGCAISPDGRYPAYTELRWGDPEVPPIRRNVARQASAHVGFAREDLAEAGHEQDIVKGDAVAD